MRGHSDTPTFGGAESSAFGCAARIRRVRGDSGVWVGRGRGARRAACEGGSDTPCLACHVSAQFPPTLADKEMTCARCPTVGRLAGPSLAAPDILRIRACPTRRGRPGAGSLRSEDLRR